MKRPNRITIVRVAAMVGLVVIARSLPARGRAAPPTPPAAPGATTPAPVAAPVQTARATANRILATYASYPTLSAADAEKSVRELASGAAADRLAADLRADLARLAAGYPGGATRVWVGPLAVREKVMSPVERREEVWFARVVAPPGRDVYAEWRLATLELIWERDGWRLNTFDEVAGPQPAVPPGSPDPSAEILTRLGGFSGEEF